MKVYTSCYWRYHGRNGVQITPSKPSDGYVYRALPSLYPPWPAIKAWNEAKYLDKDSPKRKRVWDKQAQMYWQQLTRLGAACCTMVMFYWVGTENRVNVFEVSLLSF